MNSVTRMSNIGFGLSHGGAIAGESGHDGNSGAVKAQMGETNSAEKLMPLLGCMFGEIDKLLPLLFFRPPHERYQIDVNRGGVDTIALCCEADRAALQIDVVHRDSCFRDTATLAHRHEPRILHPWLLFPKCCFDFVLLSAGDFRLLFWWDSFVSEFQTWIGVDVISAHCFLQNRRENFQLCQRRIEFSRSDKITGWISAELRIGSANLIRDLKRRDHIDVIQIGGDRGPCVSVPCQRFRIRVLISKETWDPNVEPIALSVSIDVQFMHGVLCSYLLDLPKRAVVIDSNFGTLVCPGAVEALISNPVERACVSLVIKMPCCAA